MKKTLISATALTLFACISLPALSQDAPPTPEQPAPVVQVSRQASHPAPVAVSHLDDLNNLGDDLAFAASEPYDWASIDPVYHPTQFDPIPMPRQVSLADYKYNLDIPPMSQADYDIGNPPPQQLTPTTNPALPTDKTPMDVTPADLPTPSEVITPSSSDKTSDNLSVVGLTPFTEQANYMSLAGKLRYDTYASTGNWMTREEAVAQVDTQLGSASR